MFDIFDCHCDTLTKAMWENKDLYKNDLHLDIDRLKGFGKAIQIFAIWLDMPYLNRAYENTIKAIDFFEQQLKIYGRYITSDIGDENKIRAILSVEGGEAVEGDMDKLHYLRERGIRLMTLTWNNENEIGYGAATGVDKGLKDFGKAVVREMNDTDMLIDVSHLNEKGFWDVYKISQKPFIATHSDSKALCNHCRNLTDDQLKAMAETKSMVGVNLYPPFIDGEKGSLDNIIRHIDHIMNIMGDKNTALGCDFDGIDICPENIDDVSKLNILYDRVNHIWGKEIADNIFYNNMLAFFKW